MTLAAEVFTVVTGIFALIAVVGSISYVTRSVLIARLILGKMRVGRLLRREGAPGVKRIILLREIAAQASAITRGRSYSVADELKWLSANSGAREAITFDPAKALMLRDLSRLYVRFGTALQIRTFLLGGNQPVLEKVSRVAQEVGTVLAVQAINRPVRELKGSTPEPRWLERRTAYRSTRSGNSSTASSLIRIEVFEHSDQGVAHNVQVSWIPRTEEAEQAHADTPDHARRYNGLLPLLKQHRYERSLADGNYRIHLELGEIYYDDHRKLTDPGRSMEGVDYRAAPMLLTFSLLPVTTDGYFIIARRGNIGHYPNCWGPGSGGNLEIPMFGGAVDDLDRHGVIDPLKALARETREELGLHLDLDQIQVLGLAQVSNAEERGTYVMPALAMTGLSLQELSRATAHVSAVSGRWEIGDRLAAIPMPRNEKEAEALFRWAVNDPECMPHLVVNIIQLVSFATAFNMTRCLDATEESAGPMPQGVVTFAPGSEVGESLGGRGPRASVGPAQGSLLRALVRRIGR
jgi:hypothetical protein